MEGNCAKCGMYRWSLDRDHIVPRWKAKRDGWSAEAIDDPSNIQHLCQNCHWDKTREDRKGLIPSIEARQKRAIAWQKTMEDPVRKAAVSAAITATHKGAKRSTQTKANISAGLLGNTNCLGSPRIFSDEHRAKLSKAKLGNKNRLGASTTKAQEKVEEARFRLENCRKTECETNES